MSLTAETLNKNFNLHMLWSQPVSHAATLEYWWNRLLGSGYSIQRRSNWLGVPHWPIGLWLQEVADRKTERAGPGYIMKFDFADGLEGLAKNRSVHAWVVQPSELNEVFDQIEGIGQGGATFISPRGLWVSCNINGTKPWGASKISSHPLGLLGHCFLPEGITEEGYERSLEGYLLLKQACIDLKVSECYALPSFDLEDPEAMGPRQFQFGYKRPNKLIKFFEERRMPNEEELAYNPYGADKNEVAPWHVVVPPGVHELPTTVRNLSGESKSDFPQTAATARHSQWGSDRR